MIVLGISDSHEAHACIVRDGVLVSAMAEERLSRLKADMGYPKRSIDAVLELAGVTADQIDVVAFAGQRGTPLQRLYKMNAIFKVEHWIKQCHNYWGPVLLEGKALTVWDDFDFFRHLRPDIEDDPYYSFVEQARDIHPDKYSDLFCQVRIDAVIKHLGVDPRKIRFYRHEDCHKAYGIFSSPEPLEKAIVLTAEGGGDDSSATMSVWGDGKIEEHWSSNNVNLGRLYRYVTLILGMLPSQHEYKVMGLAPFGTEYNGRRALEFFNQLSSVNGIEIRDNGVVSDLYFSVRAALEGERFDGIAWALQTHLEKILQEWVENCIQETGIRKLVFSGGIGQNIKACKHLIDETSLETLWAGPICGDGSLGIGAAWLAMRELRPNLKIAGLDTIYLGTEYDATAIDAALKAASLGGQFTIVQKPSVDRIASWIADGAVCGRFSGRMEFGQRALGARSIIADPRHWDTVERINQKIKYRDFWMPFTPSMTLEEANRIVDNPKDIYSPYMTVAFDLKEQFHGAIPAATHPADKTVRPQMLRREDNPGYYDLLCAFGEISGVSCLLNTSFNLHGDAIVESPAHAVDTFLRSDIDVLLFDHVAVTRHSQYS